MIPEFLIFFGLIYICLQTLFFLNCLNARRRDIGRLSKAFQDLESGNAEEKTREETKQTLEIEHNELPDPLSSDRDPCKRTKMKFFSSNIISPSKQDYLLKDNKDQLLKEYQRNPFKRRSQRHPSQKLFDVPVKDSKNGSTKATSSFASKFARCSMKSGRSLSTNACAKTQDNCAKLKVALLQMVKSDSKCFNIKTKFNNSNDDVFNLNDKMFTSKSCLKHRCYSEGDITYQSHQETLDFRSSSSCSSDDSFDQADEIGPGPENQSMSVCESNHYFHSLNTCKEKISKCRYSSKKNKGTYSFVNSDEDRVKQSSLSETAMSLNCNHQHLKDQYQNTGIHYQNIDADQNMECPHENKESQKAMHSRKYFETDDPLRDPKEDETDQETSCDEFTSSGPVSLIRTISRILISPPHSVTSDDQSENENKSHFPGDDPILKVVPKETYPPPFEVEPIPCQKPVQRSDSRSEKEERKPKRSVKRIGSVDLLPFQKQLELIILHHAAKLKNTMNGISKVDEKKAHIGTAHRSMELSRCSDASDANLLDEPKLSQSTDSDLVINSPCLSSLSLIRDVHSSFHGNQELCHESMSLHHESQSLKLHESLTPKVVDLAQAQHSHSTTDTPCRKQQHKSNSYIFNRLSISMLELNVNHAVPFADRQVCSLSRLKRGGHSSDDWSLKPNLYRGQERNLIQIHSRNGCQPDSMEGKASPEFELMDSGSCCDLSNDLESDYIKNKDIRNNAKSNLAIKQINCDQNGDLNNEAINDNNVVNHNIVASFGNKDTFINKRDSLIHDPNNNSDLNEFKECERKLIFEKNENRSLHVTNGDSGYYASSHEIQSCGSSSGDESVSELSSTSSMSEEHYGRINKHYNDTEHYEAISNGSSKSRNSEREKQVIQGLDDLIAEYDDDRSSSHLSTPPTVSKSGSANRASSSQVANSAFKPFAPRSPDSVHSALTRTTSVEVAASPPKLPHKNVSRTSSEPQKLSSKPPPPPPLPLTLSTSYTENSGSSDNNNQEAIPNGNFPDDDSEDEGNLPSLTVRSVNGKTQSFLPPKFPGHQAGHGLIKPSEYLKSLADLPETVNSLPPIPESSKEDEGRSIPPVPPMPPPPPPLPISAHSSVSSIKSNTMKSKASLNNAIRMTPMPSISVTDLQSVQLRKTENKLTKTSSVPLKIHTDKDFLTQRSDVIAELKMGVDIDGIKKLKHEKVKGITEIVQKEKEEIKKQFVVDNFVEQVPDVDGNGNPIPMWKRQMLAKKAAEKAKKEAEEQRIREIEEQRLQKIPPWKRQLIAKKEEERQRSRVAVNGTGSTLRTLQPIATVKL